MPTFKLSEDTVSRLKAKFEEFQNARKKVHELITRYVADYRQFDGKPDDRKEFLDEKYSPQAPSLSHLVFDENQIYWNVNDIAILLGRTQQAISATLLNIERSEGWVSRLLPLRRQTKSANGNKIFVYSEEIFDLIIDRYEEEYLLRFVEPRRGNPDNASDIEEIRRFWNYLKEFESSSNRLALKEQESVMPDVPPMTLKDILNVIWKKVFDIKIGTLCSVIFAICFEVARRYFSVSLWFSIIPAIILCTAIFLIHKRKFSADTLSDVGAGALLFLLLWISGALSLSSKQPPEITQKLTLQPQLSNNEFRFSISATNFSDVKEFFYRISPDINFHSTGFIEQNNPNNEEQYPNPIIKYKEYSDVAEIDVKYINNIGKESEVWHFSFDLEQERFKLQKQNTLTYVKNSWLEARRVGDKDFIMIDVPMLNFSAGILDAIIYGVNTLSPDIRLDVYDIDFDYWEVLRRPAGQIDFVSSYIVFTDGTSSDIRVSRIEE